MNCPECGGENTIVERKMSGQLYKSCEVDECQWEYSTSRKDDYSWVTDEMFDGALEGIVDGLPASTILRIPGAYEVLSEALNNEVLTRLEESRGEEE